jgi:hypothetical protein
MTGLLKKISYLLIFAAVSVAINILNVSAEVNIGNGKLFTCLDQQIIVVKSNKVFSLKKALRRFNSIILRSNGTLSTAQKGSSQFKKARKQKKNAIQGRKDALSCQQGELQPKPSIVGSWNLLTENGSTPIELDFDSLTITFTDNSFESTFTGTTLTCDWTGSYTNTSKGSGLILLTNSGVGGTACEQAIGQFRSATFELSEDGNILTLDYRPDGTLQVFERIN